MKRLLLLVLLAVFCTMLTAESVVIAPEPNQVQVLRSDNDAVVLQFKVNQFDRTNIQINGMPYALLNVAKEGISLVSGEPQLPTINRNIMIGDQSLMQARIVKAKYIDYPMAVAPSKGNLTRNINPETIPYTFSNLYQQDSFYPANIVDLSEPFILRDFRGITVQTHPFQYNPVTKTLRVYTDFTIAVENTGLDTRNILTRRSLKYNKAFETIYTNQFMNFTNNSRYTAVDERGRMIVIAPSQYITTVQPYVNWKRQKGIQTDLVDIATIGATSSAIKTYIQTQYNSNTDLAFVQLVGDAAQIPTLSSGGGGSDPSYALVAGNDSYPDIFIGRFSAETTAQLATQVTRTVTYERDLNASATWIMSATGIASNQGGSGSGDLGESDQVHMENIRTKLLTYGYSPVDQLYENLSATIGQVSAVLNQGRGFLNYVGHGSDTSWGTTGFSNSNVANLTNRNMLPFILSVACVNGNFTSQTCFAEAWLRATNNDQPTGAIAFYGSSINQDWNPPMRAQDEVTDLIRLNQKNTIGGLFYNGSCKMIEAYGSSGINMYKTWHIFGDASLQIRTKTPQTMTVQSDPILFIGTNTYAVNANTPDALVALTDPEGAIIGSGYTDATGQVLLSLQNAPTSPETLTLTVTGFNKVTHITTVQVNPSTGPYVVASAPAITDNGNNIPEYGETVQVAFSLNNVGVAAANGVTLHLSSNDPYITVVDSVKTYGNIAVGGTSSAATPFTVRIAANSPDQHNASVHVRAVSSDNNVWESDRMFVLNAPVLQVMNYVVDDAEGNSNGRIDPNETVILTVPINNVGHAGIENATALLTTSSNVIAIEPINNSISSIPSQGTQSATFRVSISNSIPSGTQINFTTSMVAGAYTQTSTVPVVVGLSMADFESGTLGSYPWQFTSGNWTVVNSGAYAGAYCVKTPAINNSATTSMSVTLTVPTAGTVSFYSKVSSESDYDYLKFYINSTEKGSWSGEEDWAIHSYPVSAGSVTFKWTYSKDTSQTGGSDCAWLDNIVFPITTQSTGAPVVSLNTSSINFGTVPQNVAVSRDLVVSNTGNVILVGKIALPSCYSASVDEVSTRGNVDFFVAPNSNKTITITLLTDAATISDSIATITTDDPSQPTIAVTLAATMVVGNDDPHVVPVVTALNGNYPNPFNPITTIRYSVKNSQPVSINVYNTKGQLVKTLVRETKQAGVHQIVWDGSDNHGNHVSSGVYFYRMTAGNYSATSKMILMK